MPDHRLVLASPALALPGLRTAIRSLEDTLATADTVFTQPRLLAPGSQPDPPAMPALEKMLRAIRS